MNILLVDTDSTIPNIALCKLSYWHKKQNDNVDFIKLNIPYYPNRKKPTYNIDTLKYDKTYCSVIFDGNIDYIKGDNIIFGGTGYSLKTKLDDEIENCQLDYSLYSENNISYGFITRGCIRKCKFCKVPEKEGYIRQVNTIDNIVRHEKVKFLDNNILALPNHLEILEELAQKRIKHQFNQGLDIRLLTEENSEVLSRLNYLQEYIFAFDSWSYKNIIEEKLKLLKWVRNWGLKFFVYVHPNMKIEETVHRIEFLKERKCLPYIMRDISCWNSENNDFYVDIAAWGNQPNLIKKMSFREFLRKRHKNKDRIEKCAKLYYECLYKCY